MPTRLYAVVAPCDHRSVTLEEYDSLVREWLREAYAIYKDKTGASIGELATRSGLNKPDLSNAINRRAKRRRNVSKEMFVALTNTFDLTMSEAFHRLSVLADRYENGLLMLDVPRGGGDLVVQEEHIKTTRAVATAVSKLSGARAKKNKPEPTARPSSEDEATSPRKS
jgi:hypothetical protein